MKKLLLSILLSTCLALIPHATFAHVLVIDTIKTRGIIVHVNPNDDPVAGRPSQLFFDIQDPALLGKNTSLRLTLTKEGREVGELPLSASHSSLSATYTFPTQGIYDFTLTIINHDKSYVFHFSQSVTRGVAAIVPYHQSHPLAEAALAVSTGLLAVTLIVAFNRRHEISAQSTF